MARRRTNFSRALKVLSSTPGMKVAFRVDASGDVGFGHLSRCINLAEVLRRRGNEVLFICRDDEAKKIAKILANQALEQLNIFPDNVYKNHLSTILEYSLQRIF